MAWRRIGHLWPLAIALVLAVAVRVPHLGRQGYDLDEMWAAEVAVGRGSPHATLPTDVVIDAPPRLTWPADRPGAAAVWSHLAATHPPLYEVLLRAWQELLGPGDARERALSTVAGVAAVAVLYDVVRVRSGRWPAACAAVLLAVAVPQVQYARLTRSYALLTVAALAMADALARIEVRGPTRRRSAALAIATAATLLTHYFAAAAVAATGGYALLAFRGRPRRSAVLAMAAGTAVFALAWGPFVAGQRHLFARDDPATDFLRSDLPGHVGWTLWRAALVPLTMLFPQPPQAARFAVAGAVLYAVPLLLAGRSRSDRAGLTFWAAWLLAVVGLVTALDLARGTTHLFYVRYVILAGPAVCALLPTVLAAAVPGRPWVVAAACAAAVGGCLLAVADTVDDPDRSPPAELRAAIGPPLSADDLLLFTAPPRYAQFAGAHYLLFDRYLGPIPCPVVVLTRPASPAVMDRLRRSRRAWVFGDVDLPAYLPHAHQAGQGRRLLGYGDLIPIRADAP